MSLSLSPRFDLFRFVLPKQFLSERVIEKYTKLLNRDSAVITTPIDYLNESVKSIHIPGISGLSFEQQQHEFNPITPVAQTANHLGRINVEPQHTVVYKTAENPLEKIEREFKVSFRMNQGLYNYYMLYETIFEQTMKDVDKPVDDILYIEILDESGRICGRIVFKDCHIDGIDGLDFSYDKSSRETGEFDVTFKFNNIDFEFLP